MIQERSERRPLIPQLNVIAGPMFSGKTGQLIERVKRYEIAERSVQVFKPTIDVRSYGQEKVGSHAGARFPAIPVHPNNPESILDLVKDSIEVVAIDEVQFFNQNIKRVCEELIGRGKVVIAAGLPTDFRGESFGSMPELMAMAETVDRIHAVCMSCGEEADFTQRVVNGKPAHYDEPIVLIGASESYEARCRDHHEVPGRP